MLCQNHLRVLLDCLLINNSNPWSVSLYEVSSFPYTVSHYMLIIKYIAAAIKQPSKVSSLIVFPSYPLGLEFTGNFHHLYVTY
jgi:hypothetical protein